MTPSSPKKTLARRALATQSDGRLVRLMREGQEPAFGEIVRRYQAPLTAYATAIVPFHRAEDVVQASFIKAHAALLADDREISLHAWLFTIVRNGALNVARDDPDWQELDPSYDGVPQPPAIAEQNEELQRLVTAICALPADQRRALVGREFGGEGHAQLAVEMGTTPTAIRGLIFRARTRLRDAVGAAIPLPFLRLMILQGPAAGTAGLGADAAISGGTKLAAVLSAAAIALGGGLAIERSDKRTGVDTAEAADRPTADGSGHNREAPLASPATRGGSAPRAAGGADGGKGGLGDGQGPAQDSSGRAAGGSGHDGDSSGKGSGVRGDSDDDNDHSGPGRGSSGSSGPGSGSDDDDHSGSGSDDDDHSGPGSGSDDNSSGPGGGDHSGSDSDSSFDDDHSGSGKRESDSGGSGSDPEDG